MRIETIEWNENTISHIARHGVEPIEVEEACFENKPLILKSRQGRYVALSQTISGRYLTVVLEYIGGGKAKVITARAMSEPERRLYRRR